MFKQILINTFLIIIVIVILFNCINFYLIYSHKLYISPDLIKYKYLKKYSEKVKISTLKENDIFFTKKQWKSSNNNYFKFNERYFIIERNYYYKVIKNLTINNDSFVFKLKENKI